MGICMSEECRLPVSLDESLRSSCEEESQIYKVLIAGKLSQSLFKRIECSYGSGFSRDFRIMAIPVIHHFVISAMKTLIAKLPSPIQVESSKTCIQEIDSSEVLDEEVAFHMQNLWNDPVIQTVFTATLLPQRIGDHREVPYG
eukprot:TRINITY_DN6227_c0_g1_i3.p1 TRINITY_DN6227_c0_g1~~TRINITY_DN6227_c0_g1_i3.p1  ORF type:complete len:143 (+),score=33.29 TRINITY_DN6227_c0_g1_i3:575-1003(+)